eukprot:4318878-Pleurochrysis_carterae.AAC.2
MERGALHFDIKTSPPSAAMSAALSHALNLKKGHRADRCRVGRRAPSQHRTFVNEGAPRKLVVFSLEIAYRRERAMHLFVASRAHSTLYLR